MAILENYNVEVEDLTLGELYPTKKAMNDDMQGIANRGYCQPKEQYVFSADYISTPHFITHDEIGTFGETTTKVYNTTFKQMYETDKIRHNFCLIKAPDYPTKDIYSLLRTWSFPFNPLNTSEYDEQQPPNDISSLSNAHFIKSFNFKECVFRPYFTYSTIVDGLLTSYVDDIYDDNEIRTLTGATKIKDRQDIYVSSVQLYSAIWNKTNNSWDYGVQIAPMIYGFEEIVCLQMFTAMFGDFSYTIQTNISVDNRGLIQESRNSFKTYYYDYYEGSSRKTYASRLKFGNNMPEITFIPDLSYERGKAQILYENSDFVFLAYQTNATQSYITYTFKKMYKIGYVYKKLAELGLYFSGNKGVIVNSINRYMENLTPDTLMSDNNIYLGEMLEGGITTGNFLRGVEIVDSKSPNKSGSNIDINYKPSFDVSDDDIIDRFRYGGFNRANDFLISYIMNSEKLTQLAAEFKQPTNPIPTGDTPFDSIVGLRKYPINLTRYAETYSATAQNIKLSSWDTNVQATVLLGNHANINIGSFYIEPKFNNFLDYEPYTSAEMYLPFAEFVPISLNKCMGNTIDIEMIFDVESGNIQYLIMCEGLLIAEASGNISSSQALSGVNFGLKNLQDVQNSFGLYSNAVSTVSSVANGDMAGAFAKGILSIMQMGHNEQVIANANYSTQKGQTQTDVSHYSLLDVVLHLSRPVVKVPTNYGKTIGYILNETKVLNELTGYTICNNVIINSINCLENEKTEIKSLLETGVIL